MSTEETKANPPEAVARYYSAKLAEHGHNARGADWNGEDRQVRCFSQLVKVISEPSNFSINDLGCGYGALFGFLSQRNAGIAYHGYDVSMDMIAAARNRYTAANASFTVASTPASVADYGIACGIFSVRLDSTDKEWEEYMAASLDVLARTSTRGFAFNALTTYSDADRKQQYLYYADPCRWFDVCKRKYSRNVALLHDYGLYEFTILVRKDL